MTNTPYVYYLNTAYYRNTCCSLQYPGAYNSYRQRTEKYIGVLLNVGPTVGISACANLYSPLSAYEYRVQRVQVHGSVAGSSHCGAQ